MTPLKNDLSEKAVLLVKLAHRDYQMGVTAGAGLGQVVVAHARLGRQSTSDSRKEACLFRMVSVIETFTDLLFDLALAHDVPSVDVVTERLMFDVLSSASNWPRRKTFGARYGVPVASFGEWAKVDSAIAARNSIAHGLGTVTRLQNLRSLQTKLGAIGISIVDGRVTIPGPALSDLRTLLVDYIRFLDESCGPIES